MKSILEVKDLSISFTQYTKGLRQREINVVKDLSIEMHEGEILALLGASGSGKSLLAHAIFGLLPSNAKMSGSILYRGRELDQNHLSQVRGKEIAFVPQTVNSLDPLMKVGKQVQYSVKGDDKVERQREAFARYNLPEKSSEYLPYQLSGGMARRALVCTAMLSGADLIVADEPTPGMDAEAVAETLLNIKQLADNGSSMLVIIHDIEAALEIADRIAVLYDGSVIEVARREDFCGQGEKLKHPYTKAMWNALPRNGFNIPDDMDAIVPKQGMRQGGINS